MFVFFTVEDIIFTTGNIGNICLARKLLDTLLLKFVLKRSSKIVHTFTLKPYLGPFSIWLLFQDLGLAVLSHGAAPFHICCVLEQCCTAASPHQSVYRSSLMCSSHLPFKRNLKLQKPQNSL